MPINFDFSNRKIILTGATGGMGVRITQAFLDSGAKVFATDIQQSILDSSLPESENLKKVACDLTNIEELRTTMKNALSWLNGCDVLCNIAGYMPIRPPLELTKEDWDPVLGVNLLAPYF